MSIPTPHAGPTTRHFSPPVDEPGVARGWMAAGLAAAGALLLAVFAAGPRSFLAVRTPGASILPQVASAGLLLTAVVQIVGTGLDTEFTQGARGNVAAGAITFYGPWLNTIPWYWGGIGPAAVAVAFAAFRSGALPHWIGLISLLPGAATTLFAVSPLEYMAAMSGGVWLLITSIGLLLTAVSAAAKR